MAQGETPDSTRLSFETDIRPLFREKDRSSMLKHFDLWWYADVVKHQSAILTILSEGGMPCDGQWLPSQVATLRRWVDEGARP
jgi:hypothetical protein